MDFTDLTIGIEEEYQIIDPQTRELTSYISEFLKGKAMLFRDQVKPEFLQSQVETGSLVCRNVREVREQVKHLRSLVGEIADGNNRKLVPFWLGRNTGLKSYRSVIFDDLPRTGLPEYFDSASEYEEFVQSLINTNCIDEPTKIWWDIRPHPKFPTLEFRICDCTTKIDEVVAIAALLQAMVAKLIQLRKKNQTGRRYRRALIGENKWRAIKMGIDGKFLDWGKEEEVPLRSLIEELLEILSDVVDELGSGEEIEYIRTILKEGTSADRQLRTYQKTEGLEAVVDMLAEETMMGL